MGSVAKVFKKAKKVIKKPISKITKGIARGIAKVGKSVMKGVAKLNKKLGPIGMIALSVAMPYAMSGLSTGTTGLMNSSNAFLRSIGNVGNAIRTGYQASTGAIGKTWSTITKSIGNGFQKFAGNFKGKGNIWSRISQGAKNLFNSARNTVKKFTPKFRQGTSGSVDVYGLRGNVHGEGLIKTSMKSADAVSMLQSGAIDASQISGQSLGSTEGWFTHAGSSEADKVITETINSAMKDNVNLLQGDSQRYFNDLVTHQKSVGSYVNDSQAFDSVINNSGTKYNGLTDWDGYYSTDLAATGDYTHHLGKARDSGISTYEFHGGKTFDNSIGKSSIKKASNLKKNAKYAAGTMAKSLLSQDSAYKLPEVMYASTADMTQTTTGGYGGTEIEGSWGGSLLKGAFNDDQRERIMNFYKNMNIVGSH